MFTTNSNRWSYWVAFWRKEENLRLFCAKVSPRRIWCGNEICYFVVISTLTVNKDTKTRRVKVVCDVITKMPMVCPVYGCWSKSTQENRISFHKFLEIYTRRQKWIRILKIGTKLKWSSARVCGKHFSTVQYDNPGNIEGELAKSCNKLLMHITNLLETRRLRRTAFPDSNIPSTKKTVSKSLEVIWALWKMFYG